mmetsp:Transcript_151988/g.487949  ORF Transcript_151988/g.487949 Transcript_151988/m.487949 type:complete len:204 (-) Transcript_151988:3352-3963(-)
MLQQGLRSIHVEGGMLRGRGRRTFVAVVSAPPPPLPAPQRGDGGDAHRGVALEHGPQHALVLLQALPHAGIVRHRIEQVVVPRHGARPQMLLYEVGELLGDIRWLPALRHGKLGPGGHDHEGQGEALERQAIRTIGIMACHLLDSDLHIDRLDVGWGKTQLPELAILVQSCQSAQVQGQCLHVAFLPAPQQANSSASAGGHRA